VKNELFRHTGNVIVLKLSALCAKSLRSLRLKKTVMKKYYFKICTIFLSALLSTLTYSQSVRLFAGTYTEKDRRDFMFLI